MTLNQLAKEISQREGLKKQVNIAQIKEIIGVIADLSYENFSITLDLYDSGYKRAKKRNKK